MANYTVYVTRRLPDSIRQQLEEVGSVIMWDDVRPIPRSELLTHISAADALLCMSDDQIDADVIAAAPRLRVISTASAGYDHIDIATAASRQIVVCHTPGVADHAVADMTMAMLLTCARHMVDADLFVKHRQWEHWSPDLFVGEEVRGSTLGIIGLGHVGVQVAHRAMGFSMRILYADIRRDHDVEESLRIAYGSLDNLLQEADFVTLHVPLTPATRGMIGERELALMKPTAYLINISRGALVEHAALVRALREGQIAGAALDVYETEPIPPDDPLLDLPNVLLSPHIAANTRKTNLATFRLAVEQIRQALHGETPAHRVAGM